MLLKYLYNQIFFKSQVSKLRPASMQIWHTKKQKIYTKNPTIKVAHPCYKI